SAVMASPGLHWPDLPICLIEVTFSDGLVGLGELSRGIELAAIAPWVQQLVGRSVCGPSAAALPTDFRSGWMWGLEQAWPVALWDVNPLGAALEMALLDWSAKRAGCRVVDLLGGAYREEI